MHLWCIIFAYRCCNIAKKNVWAWQNPIYIKILKLKYFKDEKFREKKISGNQKRDIHWGKMEKIWLHAENLDDPIFVKLTPINGLNLIVALHYFRVVMPLVGDSKRNLLQ